MSDNKRKQKSLALDRVSTKKELKNGFQYWDFRNFVTSIYIIIMLHKELNIYFTIMLMIDLGEIQYREPSTFML